MKELKCIKCPVGYIYCLYVDGIVSYIGKTEKSVKDRYSLHKYDCFTSHRSEKEIYKHIKSLGITIDDFSNRVIAKPIMVSSLYDLNLNEMKYIKYCIDKGKNIFNNCVKTNSYKIGHHISTKSTPSSAKPLK